MPDEIVNKVAQSPIITIDIAEFYPSKQECKLFDIANYLYEGLILKEKDFRQQLKILNYEEFQDKYVSIYCSADAIIPQWAFMLAGIHLFPYAKKIYYGDEQTLIQNILLEKIKNLDINKYKDRPIVVKGCGNVKVDINIYIQLCNQLLPYVKSIMYGEPCSTVPLYKKK